MNFSEFHRQLVENGSYSTSERLKKPLLYKLLGWTDFACYAGIVRIILNGRKIALRGEYTTRVWGEQSVNIINIVEYCGGKIQITGSLNLKGLGPVVYVSNHMSMLETFMLPCMLLAFNPISIVVKEDLLSYPVFGHIMRAVEPIAVSRRDPKLDLKSVMDQGLAYLRKGKSVLVFPQATRSAVFSPDDFNSLGVKLARSAGVKVVPLALKTDFMQNGRWIKDIGRLDRTKTIYYAFGSPMEITGNGRAQHDEIVSFISKKMDEWGKERLEF